MTDPAPRRILLSRDGAIAIAWVITGILVAAFGRGGDVGGALLRALFFVGAVAQLVLLPATLRKMRAARPGGPRTRLLAHAAALGIGFGPLVLVSSLYATIAGVFWLRYRAAQDFACSNFAVKDWRIVSDPADPQGSILEVRIQAKRRSGVRLDYVGAYAGPEGQISTSSRDDGTAPIVQLAAGEVRTFLVRLEPRTAPTEWLQFTLCTRPGPGTESCGWFGHGNGRARPSAGSICNLPAPSLAVGTRWAR